MSPKYCAACLRVIGQLGVPPPADQGEDAHALKRAGAEAGIAKHVSLHTLRHSFATYLLQANTDICTMQEFLGHSDVSTMMMYTHWLKILPARSRAGWTIRCRQKGISERPELASSHKVPISAIGRMLHVSRENYPTAPAAWQPFMRSALTTSFGSRLCENAV